MALMPGGLLAYGRSVSLSASRAMVLLIVRLISGPEFTKLVTLSGGGAEMVFFRSNALAEIASLAGELRFRFPS